jgi:hypothetical protein
MVPTTREEITKFCVKYRDKITTYTNELASVLLEEEEPRRLKKFKPTDLNNQIFVNIISQICERITGEYLLGYYSSRHVLNGVGFLVRLHKLCGLGSVVRIATGYGLDGPGIESR